MGLMVVMVSWVLVLVAAWWVLVETSARVRACERDAPVCVL